MRKLGLFLLKNNIHLMTLVFAGFAVWTACNWQEVTLVQKLVMGMFALITLHEYEETMTHPGLMDLFGRVVEVDTKSITPGKSHLAQAVYIVLLFSLAMLFPEQMWIVFPIFMLGIFEGFVHTMGSFIFKTGKPTAGWYTAILMCAFSIWSLVQINRDVPYDGIQWLYAVIYFIVTFVLLEVWFQHLIGSSLPLFVRKMKAYVFGGNSRH